MIHPLEQLDDQIPAVFWNPLDTEAPHPLAARAAEMLKEELSKGFISPNIPTDILGPPMGGKMFGVLVVKDKHGALGYLKAFSGQIEKQSTLPGFVPPIFNQEIRAQFEIPGELVIRQLTARVELERNNSPLKGLQNELQLAILEHEKNRVALKEQHAGNKRFRDEERTRHPELVARYDNQSKRNDVEEREFKRLWREHKVALEKGIQRAKRRIEAAERLRKMASNVFIQQIYDTYVFTNFIGETKSLRELFHPLIPSSGTGDCAAPRLIQYAARNRLLPLALTEFWWGDAPPGGARVQGTHYPACKEKCAPLLPFLTTGISMAPVRRWKPEVTAGPLAYLYQDENVIVINKPPGLLSVLGTDVRVTDSVESRIQVDFPNAKLAHRLDLETSGVLIVALNTDALVFLQKQFLRRTAKKKYVALLDGLIAQDSGTIELPMRPDIDMRPRQMVDFAHGKQAVTDFNVITRNEHMTRVHFFPLTGRTHQLRLHASHQQGLACPIMGDSLYGKPGPRLMLHAQELEIEIPSVGLKRFVAAVPF
jgi:tRNA pseudouridine32 synthase / 23S rRNA pseudouridine746 synthase